MYGGAVLCFVMASLFEAKLRAIMVVSLFVISIVLSMVATYISLDCQYSGGYVTSDGDCAWE